MQSKFMRLMKQTLEIKTGPLPWTKAISAGICCALPPFLGLLLGNIQYGLLAGIGSFSYLYVVNEPYAQRAKKLLFVVLGMTFSVGIGTIFAPFPFVSALLVGVIGGIATFIFAALNIRGPAAIFFVLGFAMTTGMPIDQALAPVRSGLVFLGGILSWLIGMAGWLIPQVRQKYVIKGTFKQARKHVFKDALHKNSVVFLNSVRYGLTLIVAAVIAYSFEFDRPYWIIISCAAVMLGSTATATFHRAMQRTIGTLIGILAATVILSFYPEGIAVVILIMLMTFFTELFIVKNYGIAVMFITPNALLMAESTTHIHYVRYFAEARITDTLIGCAIGIAGTLLVANRAK
ncbi:FUSC family protein [Bacillus sp. FJAT-50079]|uniref:FUSC family protein n=1 Tax=Bacillus sp. FJAT-50079 TaxID=2833577 RepID=UPI001BC95C48|nr:FUSC family protein [Bacillus sp. FJAT-50079]MBS4210051.1 FUSC family protein [Bacillus sp. FJAT-50079]